MRFTSRIGLGLLASFTLCSHAAWSQTALVGFTSERGGGASLPSGSLVSTLRQGLLTAFPGTTIRGVDTLTSLSLTTDDVAVLFSSRAATTAIQPLSVDEQAALLAFVQGGGAAVIFVDNDTFGGAPSDNANESLLNPFGLDVTGTGAPWARNAVVANPPGSPITSGAFGTVASFQIGWTGWFNQLGPHAQALATASDNNQPVLAVLPCGALGPTSGPVVLFADGTMASNGFINAINLSLILNAVAFAGAPCSPACDSIDFNNDGSNFDPQDIDAFLSVYAEGPCIPETATCSDIDFNNDGALFDPCDIDAFLLVFSEGPCTACGS